jgi:hypothetical protein
MALVLANQSALRLGNGTLVSLSDDPNVNGAADPDIAGDEDPTRLTIQASPAFLVQKISTDLTGDPNVLQAGERLRYTITVRNNRERRGHQRGAARCHSREHHLRPGQAPP